MGAITDFKETYGQSKEGRKAYLALTEENQDYYKRFADGLKADSGFKSQKAVNETLDTVLSDILLAQEKGEKAEDYFGCTAEELAGEMLRQVQKNALVFASVAFGVLLSAVFMWLFVLSMKAGQFVLLTLISISLVLVCVFGNSLVFQLFPRKTRTQRSKIYRFIVLPLALIVFIGLTILVAYTIK